MNDPPVLPLIDLIDLSRCTGCGLCVELCPTRAIELRDERAVIARPADCTFCEVCESYCPEGAIGRPFVIVFAPDQRDSPSLQKSTVVKMQE